MSRNERAATAGDRTRGRLAVRAVVLATVAIVCVILPQSASAVVATGGNGRFVGAIDWVVWGTNNQTLDLSGPITRMSTSTYGGQTLVVSCTISNFARAGGGTPTLRAYRSGNWGGDALDELYNIGGEDGANTLVNGLSAFAQQVSFDFACNATLDGNPYPLNGLVFADGEQSTGNEFVSGEIADSATWRLIDRNRDCANDSRVLRTVAGGTDTLRLDNPASTLCPTGPAGVAFADGATSGRITVNGGGVSAVALGAVLTFDHGDAPASYGDAVHAVQFSFTGGVPPVGASALFGGNTLADTTQPSLHLGPSVDPEAGTATAGADGDDASPTGAFGPGDDETDDPPATITVAAGGSYTLPGVACTGTGSVAGWIDFDGDGVFGGDERSQTAACTTGSVALTWSVPADLAPQPTSYLRLRFARNSNAAQIAAPSGLALSGEVEDHVLAIALDPNPVPLVDPRLAGLVALLLAMIGGGVYSVRRLRSSGQPA